METFIPQKSCVVYDNVNPTKGIQSGLHYRLATLRRAHGVRVGNRLAAGVLDFLGTRSDGPASPPSPEGEPPRSLTTTLAPRVASQQGVFPPESSPGARNNRNPAVEPEICHATRLVCVRAINIHLVAYSSPGGCWQY